MLIIKFNFFLVDIIDQIQMSLSKLIKKTVCKINFKLNHSNPIMSFKFLQIFLFCLLILHIHSTQSLHAFKIYPEIPLSSEFYIDLEALRQSFSIAALYYSKVIKVRDLTDVNATHYPSTANVTCGVEVPRKYYERGFDQRHTDLVVFIALDYDIGSSFIASSSHCAFKNRPIYGYIRLNTANFHVDFTQKTKFHSSIMILIHEIIHILVFQPKLFNEFRLSPNSPTKRPISQVTKNIGGRQFVVTHSVKKYAQTYFDCSLENFGALLQNGQGGNSHWSKALFGDELMTATPTLAGARITPVTLFLLFDSNFFDEVDTTMAEVQKYGYKGGCQFGWGVRSYKNYQTGFCNHTNLNTSYTQGKPCSEADGLEFRYDTRCYQWADGNGTICAPTRCWELEIKIFDNGTERTCKKGQMTFKIGEKDVLCPEKLHQFCFEPEPRCPNWCNTHGICLNGTCICQPPYFGVECSDSCPNYYDTISQQCVDSCPKGTYLDILSRLCVRACPSGFLQSSDGQCIVCDLACLLSALQSSSSGSLFVPIAVLTLLLLTL